MRVGVCIFFAFCCMVFELFCIFFAFVCIFSALSLSGAPEARKGSGKGGNDQQLGRSACVASSLHCSCFVLFLHFLTLNFFASGAPEACISFVILARYVDARMLRRSWACSSNMACSRNIYNRQPQNAKNTSITP